LLKATGLPYIIENVVGADMPGAVICCGARLCPVVYTDPQAPEGLVLKRHRQFESNIPLVGSGCLCKGSKWVGYKVGGVYGGGSSDRNHAEQVRRGGYTPAGNVRRELMGINWCTINELSQAIPPAYTEFIGIQLLQHLSGEVGE
jgi:DNA (cytosine-5)-methyltransferase 1